MFFLPHNARKRTIPREKENGIKMSKYKTDRRNWVFSLCCIIMGNSEAKKSTEQREEVHVFVQPKRSTAGESICQPSTCVPASTEQAQDTLRRQQRELLQPLTKAALPRFMLFRPTGGTAGGAHLVGGTRGAVLGAGIHLFAIPCWIFLFHSCPGVAGDQHSSNPSNPNKSQG